MSSFQMPRTIFSCKSLSKSAAHFCRTSRPIYESSQSKYLLAGKRAFPRQIIGNAAQRHVEPWNSVQSSSPTVAHKHESITTLSVHLDVDGKSEIMAWPNCTLSKDSSGLHGAPCPINRVIQECWFERPDKKQVHSHGKADLAQFYSSN